MLSLYLLGPPRIERDGVPVEVDTRKAIALLAYLALTGSRHRRDELAVLLWPEHDQTHARGALRRTLSALNKALSGAFLDVERESIGLPRGDNLWVDIDIFRGLVTRSRGDGAPRIETEMARRGASQSTAVSDDNLAALVEAIALYRDEFLAGFTLRDSPAFDEWQLLQGETLRRELADALERLVRALTTRREFQPAITYARRWLALDPLHEPTHRCLMLLYAWSGQRTAALRQYRECVQVLEQELGVPPLEETTRLYHAIKEDRTPPPDEPAPPLPPPTIKDGQVVSQSLRTPPSLQGKGAGGLGPPFVGRSLEWARLLETYAAIGPDGRFVAIEGEAGIGKTRLAEEFLAGARRHGAAIVSARCYEGEGGLAYGPFVDALRSVLSWARTTERLEAIPAHWLSEAARLLPELLATRPGLAPSPPLDGPGAQSRFFDGVSQTFLALVGATPIPQAAESSGDPGNPSGSLPPPILFFDDLHWADSASLDLLTYLTRRLRGRPLYVLATWRGEDVPAAHKLRQLLGEAQRAGTATLLRLPRLTRDAVVEFVSAVAGANAAISVELAERLYHETEGLPFFLVEYLAANPETTVASSQISDASRQSGENSTATIGDWRLTSGIRDLLRSRLATVSETGWQVLTTAAVVGRSFDFDTLREASGRGEEEAVAALEELLARGLIQEVSGGAGEALLVYDFTHEKLRALVYDETSLARRRLLHRRVAESLLERLRGRTSQALAGQIAHHYQLAGQEAEAAAYFRMAGEHARGLYANAEALTHFQAALALGHPDPAGLHEAIGDLQTLRGEYAAALTSYETAAALAAPPALALLEHKLGQVHHRRGEWELAESHFQAALAALGDSGAPGRRARLYADWSLTALRRGVAGAMEADEPLLLARQALALAEAADDSPALAQAHNILGVIAKSRGDLLEARAAFERSLALAETLGDPSARVAALNNLALVYGAAGEVETALRVAHSALALAVSQGDRHREAALHNNLADLYHAAGQRETAMEHLKQAVAIYAEIGVEAGAWQPEIWKLTEW